MPLGEYFVKGLVKTVGGMNRNITVDNLFTSIKIGEDLLKMNLTLVGILRQNKREISYELLDHKNKKIGLSMLALDQQKTT